MLGFPCWLGLCCLLNRESLLLPQLLRLVTPQACLCYPRERAQFGMASTGQAVVAAPQSLVPKSSLDRFSDFCSRKALHHGTWNLAFLEAVQMGQVTGRKLEEKAVNTLRDKLLPKICQISLMFPSRENPQMVITILTSSAT